MVKEKLKAIDWTQALSLIDKLPKLVDVAVLGGLAYAGYKKTDDFYGALASVVGFKLATTPGGTPPVSQVIGCGLLGYQYLFSGFGGFGDFGGVLESLKETVFRGLLAAFRLRVPQN